MLIIRRVFTSSLAHPPLSQVPWISDFSEFAQSGVLQAVILGLSVLWTVLGLALHRNGDARPKQKVSSIKWPYELVSQAARGAAVVFMTLAFVQGRAHLLNVVVLAYALVLGLLRLANNLRWRHLALHQVNFVMTAMLFVLLVAQMLPCIQLDGDCPRDVSIVGGVAALAAAFLLAITTPREWVPPHVAFEIPGYTPQETPAPEEACSWLNYYCTYEWLTPIIWKGTRGKLDMSGLPKLAWYDEPIYLLRRVQQARAISKSTLWTTMRFQRKELILMSLWIAIGYSVENISPYGTFRLLEYLADPAHATYQPWIWVLLMFLGPMSRSIFFQQYIFTSTRLLVRIKSAMTQELYHKALESMELEDDPFVLKTADSKPKDDKPEKVQKTTSAGRLASLMAADIDAIYRARDMCIALIGVPAGTLISLIGMYQMLGWASIVGTIVLVIATPISIWLGQMIYRTQRRVRKAQDSRISLVTEYLASIRAIKYFAWEDAITDKIVESRAVEQKEQWRVSVLQICISQVTQIFPYISLLVMFGIHVGVEKKRLDASTAFTTIYLVKNIRRNIMQASNFARNFASALVSFGRLDKYFSSTVPLNKYPVGPLRLEKAYFRRNKKAVFRLEDISINFVEGGLNVVGGPSGSGKSTLLFGILGETYLEGGSVTRPEDVAFASQSTWLQNNTIRYNILFGSPFEQARYDRIVEACCLQVDFKEVIHGDMTVVGENGTALSGGQKARVALARALYSKAPVVLLDDVFSALDAKTAAGVWKHCFCTSLLKGRTTVLVTNVPWIAAQADLSIVLEKGEVKSAEPNIGVVREPITIAEVLGGDADDETETEDEPPEPELRANGDAMNDTTKVADDKDKGPKDIVSQEMKASGKTGRMTCTLL